MVIMKLDTMVIMNILGQLLRMDLLYLLEFEPTT